MVDRLRRLADELATLPDEELIPIIQQAFRDRVPFPDESSTDRYFIGLASQVELESEADWEIAAIAEIDMEHYGKESDLIVGPDWGCCQVGSCETCGTSACSNMKHATCSICHTNVYLT